MSLLVRATDLIGLPVVTTSGGEDVAEVKDVVYGGAEAALLGFTLNRRGFLGRPMKKVLAWQQVVGAGRHAVMVESEASLGEGDALLADDVAGARHRDVIGDEVLTDGGERLGEVTDVVILVGGNPEVVGYEIAASETLPAGKGRRVYVPLPETLAVSGEALMVPAAVRDFVTDDMAGMGAAVEAFRSHLRGER